MDALHLDVPKAPKSREAEACPEDREEDSGAFPLPGAYETLDIYLRSAIRQELDARQHHDRVSTHRGCWKIAGPPKNRQLVWVFERLVSTAEVSPNPLQSRVFTEP